MSLLEDQVCSLKLAKRLKELQIENKNILVWIDVIKTGFNFVKIRDEHYEPDDEIVGAYNYPAFTSSELISILPHRITVKQNKPFNSFTLYIKKSIIVNDAETDNPIVKYIYAINYECDSTEATGENAWLKRQLFIHNIWDENFSNALAKTLISLIENKYI